MTPAAFRRIALALPEAIERAHMNHPDFRVGGKVFATLGYPDGAWGMVKLRPDQQADLVDAAPDTFVPVNGAWGRGGATNVRLAGAPLPLVRLALRTGWSNAAPKNMISTPSRRAKPKSKRPAR